MSSVSVVEDKIVCSKCGHSSCPEIAFRGECCFHSGGDVPGLLPILSRLMTPILVCSGFFTLPLTSCASAKEVLTLANKIGTKNVRTLDLAELAKETPSNKKVGISEDFRIDFENLVVTASFSRKVMVDKFEPSEVVISVQALFPQRRRTPLKMQQKNCCES